MPYITTERVKEIRQELKTKYPDVKFSVTRHRHSKVCIAIMESSFEWPSPQQDLNTFYLERYPHSEFLEQVKEIANKGNGTLVEDSDYGTVPKFYVDIEIGKWDRPHVFKPKEVKA